jgi:hypothetical protein
MTDKRKKRIRELADKLDVSRRGAANRLDAGRARQLPAQRSAADVVSVEADFLADLRRIAATKLTAEGYTVEATLSTEAVLWDWLKIQHRRIERRKRRVERSSELRAREATLPEGIRSALGRIESAVQTGDDLNTYLSRDLVTDKAFKHNDLMLNELGVQHFHLGDGIDARGLVRGTDELLFAYVTDEAVHFVGVFDHRSFGDERAFRIAQENWPHLFERQRMGIAPSRDPQAITPEQRKVLRSKGANVPVSAIDGTLFLPPGGGIVTTGMSPRIVIEADRVLDRLQARERWCKANGSVLADRFEGAGGRRPTRLVLRFDGFEESGAIIVMDDEIRARFRFESGEV